MSLGDAFLAPPGLGQHELQLFHGEREADDARRGRPPDQHNQEDSQASAYVTSTLERSMPAAHIMISKVKPTGRRHEPCLHHTQAQLGIAAGCARVRLRAEPRPRAHGLS